MGNDIKFCLDSIDRLGDMTIILGLTLFSTFVTYFEIMVKCNTVMKNKVVTCLVISRGRLRVLYDWKRWIFKLVANIFLFYKGKISQACENSRRLCWYQLNFVIWGPFCFLAAILFFKILSIRTSMQNLDSVGQKMSELCSILWFGGHFVFQNFVKKWVSYAQFCDLAAILFFKFLSKFVQIVHTNLDTSY